MGAYPHVQGVVSAIVEFVVWVKTGFGVEMGSLAWMC
jgi:hypothetical protein